MQFTVGLYDSNHTHFPDAGAAPVNNLMDLKNNRFRRNILTFKVLSFYKKNWGQA